MATKTWEVKSMEPEGHRDRRAGCPPRTADHSRVVEQPRSAEKVAREREAVEGEVMPPSSNGHALTVVAQPAAPAPVTVRRIAG